MRKSMFHLFLLGSFVAVLIWSAIRPAMWTAWWYEASFAVIMVLVLTVTHRRFPFTPITYFFVWVGAIIMLLGAHYTYGNMPLFDQLKDAWHLSRNHFDRFGHFFQGVVPYLMLREIVVRKNVIHRRWLWVTLVSFSFTISGLYECFEAFYAACFENDPADFLGMQGDDWDAQWDMTSALAGAMFASLFSRWQDRMMRE
ncbi:DUF2238 domain-containing protein [Laceyella putida]|uniref:DUF2238 domain-containing protein n=1 Tax=Laceyella putida TaxID=110101 RepID=A0ABW2RFF3_9BACL